MNDSEINIVLGKRTRKDYLVNIPTITITRNHCIFNKIASECLMLKKQRGALFQIRRNPDKPCIYIKFEKMSDSMDMEMQFADYEIKQRKNAAVSYFHARDSFKEIAKLFQGTSLQFAIDLIPDEKGRHELKYLGV